MILPALPDIFLNAAAKEVMESFKMQAASKVGVIKSRIVTVTYPNWSKR